MGTRSKGVIDNSHFGSKGFGQNWT